MDGTETGRSINFVVERRVKFKLTRSLDCCVSCVIIDWCENVSVKVFEGKVGDNEKGRLQWLGLLSC